MKLHCNSLIFFPRFQTHFLPGDTIRCTSGGMTGNKEKSVILQDFFFSQIISCFFFLSCSPLLLLLFRNSCFSLICFRVLHTVERSLPVCGKLRSRSDVSIGQSSPHQVQHRTEHDGKECCFFPLIALL